MKGPVIMPQSNQTPLLSCDLVNMYTKAFPWTYCAAYWVEEIVKSSKYPAAMFKKNFSKGPIP